MDKLAVRAEQSLQESSETALLATPYRSIFKMNNLSKRQRIGVALSRAAMMTKGTTSPAMLTAYAENLEKEPTSRLARMFELAERKCKFFPTVAELFELVEEEYDEDPDNELRAHREVE